MKAKAKPSVGAKIAKFVLFWALPMVAVYFIGYKLIGPEIGKMPALDKKLQKVEKLIPSQVQPKVTPKVDDDQPADDAPVATTDPDKAPVIDISVEKAGSKKMNDGQPRKKKKKKKAETPKADTQPRDEASGDGAMGGGGDGPSDPAGGG